MNSLIISIFFLIVGCFFSINSIPLIKSSGSNVNLEPGVFPMFLGILLIIISLFMIVSSVLQIINGKRKDIKISDNNDNNEAEVSSYAIKDIIVVAISIIIFIAIWQLVNFFVGLVILIFVLFKLFGTFKLKSYIIFTISLSLVIYVVFSLVLKLNL